MTCATTSEAPAITFDRQSRRRVMGSMSSHPWVPASDSPAEGINGLGHRVLNDGLPHSAAAVPLEHDAESPGVRRLALVPQPIPNDPGLELVHRGGEKQSALGEKCDVAGDPLHFGDLVA